MFSLGCVSVLGSLRLPWLAPGKAGALAAPIPAGIAVPAGWQRVAGEAVGCPWTMLPLASTV